MGYIKVKPIIGKTIDTKKIMNWILWGNMEGEYRPKTIPDTFLSEKDAQTAENYKHGNTSAYDH